MNRRISFGWLAVPSEMCSPRTIGGMAMWPAATFVLFGGTATLGARLVG